MCNSSSPKRNTLKLMRSGLSLYNKDVPNKISLFEKWFKGPTKKNECDYLFEGFFL